MLEYKGFWNAVNRKPKSYIEIWVSDWNKDHWGFYAYINAESYEQDTKDIQDLIRKLNWRDGDVYVELINYSKDLKDFYKVLYDNDWYAEWSTLHPDYWRKAQKILVDKSCEGCKHLKNCDINGQLIVCGIYSVYSCEFKEYKKAKVSQHI